MLLFRLDNNRNGSLSLSEAQSAVSVLLRSKTCFRGTRSSTPLVPIKDFKPTVKGAYRAAASLLDAGNGSKANVGALSLGFTEFHAFLLAFRWYLELQVLFESADKSGDHKVNYRECSSASSSLVAWGIVTDDIKRMFPSAKRKDMDGGIGFQEFAEWAIAKRFGSLSLKLDTDEDEDFSDDERSMVEEEDPITEGRAKDTDAADAPVDAPEIQPAPARAASHKHTRDRWVFKTKSGRPIESWAAQLQREYATFEIGDRVEAIYNPTGDWCTGSVCEVLSSTEQRYLLAWDPAGDFHFSLDREKRNYELRPEPIPGKEETITAANQRSATSEAAEATAPLEPQPEKMDVVRSELGFSDASDPLALMKEQELIAQQFRHFDADGDGGITIEELGAVLKTLDTRFDDEAVQEVFHIADLNRDGVVDYKEFIRWLFNDC